MMARRGAPVIERFLERIDWSGGCWLWLGHTSGGYARLQINHKSARMHRWSYEYFVGPIPEGLDLDHECRVRHCVNPAHLRPMTRRENVMIGEGACARHARQTHCKRGHLLEGSNIYEAELKRGAGRICVTCRRESRRKKVSQ